MMLFIFASQFLLLSLWKIWIIT